MTIQEQYDILKRLKLHRRADITNPAIVVLCQEINKLDKELVNAKNSVKIVTDEDYKGQIFKDLILDGYATDEKGNRVISQGDNSNENQDKVIDNLLHEQKPKPNSL